MNPEDPFAGVPGPLHTALHRRGFTELTAVQQAVLQADADAHDLRISSQTGSGKTVALGLALAPCLIQRAEPSDDPAPAQPTALVIAPTRELATQVRDELRWLLAELRVGVDAVTGGTDLRGERRMLRRPPAVLVATPGRLLDHLGAGVIDVSGVAHVVLDEADRMLEMGFRDELDAIIDALPKERRSHLVSATFAGPVLRVADRLQDHAVHLQGTTLGEANEDIEHIAWVVQPNQRYAALVDALLLALGERVLVFVDRRAEAAELAELLAGDGFAALPFSGDLSQAQRNRTLHAFRSGTISVLVSTDVAARGIDVADITMVVHMSPPPDPDAYTHRSGRTGRAGQRGRSLLMVPPRAQRYATRLLSAANIEANWQPVPTPAKIHRAMIKRTRRELHARLDSDTNPDEKTLAYAAQLLEGRDPALVIATLLEQAQPVLPCEPMEVEPIGVHIADRHHAGGRMGRDGRDDRRPRKGARPRKGMPHRGRR